MQIWTYPATVEAPGPGEFIARFADVPEVLTGGETEADTLALAADALEEALLDYLARGQAIPAPRPAGEGEIDVPLDPVTAARCALAQTMSEGRVSNVALAARLGRSEGAVRRLTDGRSGVKIDTVLDALRELGRPAVLSVG